MNKKPLITVSNMNTNSIANLNRMTFLMSISEITPQLFISGQMAATIEQVQKLGITYIVNVAIESAIIPYPKTIKMEKFDIIDFPTAPISNYFNSLTDKIHAHLSANKQNKVLVHCMAGISRSTTIICAYLMRYMNLTLKEAYLLCKKNRPICFPNLGFWNQLIAYEHQLKKENSVKMIPTQFGHIPDLAFEEIKQLRAQQAQVQQPGSIPFSSSVFGTAAPTATPPESTTRTNARELSINHLNGIVRSRSLASNSTSRPSVPPLSTNGNHSIFPSTKITTNRFGLNRVMTGTGPSNPPGPSSSAMSYASHRSLPISTSPNIKPRPGGHHPPQHATTTTAAATVSTDPQRPHYETTYRSSFIKPLAP